MNQEVDFLFPDEVRWMIIEDAIKNDDLDMAARIVLDIDLRAVRDRIIVCEFSLKGAVEDIPHWYFVFHDVPCEESDLTGRR